jgi:ribonuclease P protein component
MTTQHFPKRMRVLNAKDFERVFEARVSASDGRLVLYAAANEVGHPRLGLTVSRRIGGATLRNRWKRLLREAFRLSQHELPAFDLVCVPRANSRPQLCDLMESLPALAHRLARKMQQREDASRPSGAAISGERGAPAIEPSC